MVPVEDTRLRSSTCSKALRFQPGRSREQAQTADTRRGCPVEISAHGRKSNAFNKPRHSGPAAMTAGQQDAKPSQSDVSVAMISPGTRGQGGTQGLGAPLRRAPRSPPVHSCRSTRLPRARPGTPVPFPSGPAGGRARARAASPHRFTYASRCFSSFIPGRLPTPPRKARPPHRTPRRRDTPPSAPQNGAQLPPRRRNPTPLRRGSGQWLRTAQRARAFPSTHARRVPSRKI